MASQIKVNYLDLVQGVQWGEGENEGHGARGYRKCATSLPHVIVNQEQPDPKQTAAGYIISTSYRFCVRLWLRGHNFIQSKG